MPTPEFERGRKNDDSSSSRESSPNPKQNRSFTPTSDDGTVVPETNDDDSPSPSDAPIIRQPVAFNNNFNRLPVTTTGASASFHRTPEPTPAPTRPDSPTPPATRAPSQASSVVTAPPAPTPEIPVLQFRDNMILKPPPPPPPSSSSSSSLSVGGPTTRSKASTNVEPTSLSAVSTNRKHFNDNFAQHTNTFRIKGYVTDADSADAPPIKAGHGPYSSLFRTSLSAPAPAEVFKGAQTTGPASAPAVTPTTTTNPSSATTGSPDTPSPARDDDFETQNNAVQAQQVPQNTAVPQSHVMVLSHDLSQAKVPRMNKRPKSKKRSVGNDSSVSNRESTSQGSHYSTHEQLPPLKKPAWTSSANTPTSTSPHQTQYLVPQSGHARPYTRTPPSPTYPRSPIHADRGQGSHYGQQQQQQQQTPSWTEDDYAAEHDSDSYLRGGPKRQSSVSTVAERRSRSDTTVNPPAAMDVGPSQGVRTLRMLTLLIVDCRSGQDDHQLAEVKVPLRQAENEEDGFWANAKDICDKLQGSPSRIDGPAKVYTLRGKYRQFFLRVSETGVDECTPSNLRVNGDRTLDVVVEAPTSVGMIPPPPKIPTELRSPVAELRSPTPQPVPMMHYPGQLPPPPPPPLQAVPHHSDVHMSDVSRRPHKHTPVPRMDEDYDMDDYSGPARRRTGSAHSSPDSTWATGSRSSMTMYEPSPTPPSSFDTSLAQSPYSRSGYHNTSSIRYSQSNSFAADHRERALTHANHRLDLEVTPPAPGAPDPQVDEALLKYVKSKIECEQTWRDFWRWKGSAPSAFTVLRMYRYVHSKMQEHVGMRPFSSASGRVKHSHLLRALHLDDDWWKHCSETLSLLELYGMGGRHMEDPTVISMANDATTPAPNAKPIKRLLRLLKETDEKWRSQHPDIL